MPWSKKEEDDPYWEAFVHRPPNDPNNLITHAFRSVKPGGVNPVRSEVHSPNVMAGHIRELGRFFGAHEVGILRLDTNPFDGEGEGPFSAIVCLFEAEHDTRQAQGIGGQAPALKALFVTFNLCAYIRELGFRADRFPEVDGEPLAAQAGLGTLGPDGRLISRQLGRGVHVAEVIYTDLPLEP